MLRLVNWFAASLSLSFLGIAVAGQVKFNNTGIFHRYTDEYQDISVNPGLSEWHSMLLASSGELIVTANINGIDVPALLDTGSSKMVVDNSLAKRLNLVIDQSTAANTPAGVVAGETVGMLHISLGGRGLPVDRALVSDLSAVNAATGMRFGAIIGVNAFTDGALELDFRRMRFRFTTAPTNHPDFESIPLSLVQGVPVMTASLDGRAGIRIMIDTGHNSDLSASSSLFDLMATTAGRQTTLARAGVGGISVARLTTLHTLTFQNYPLQDISLQGEASGQFIDRLRVDAVAGTRLLRRFDLILDFANHHVLLKPSGLTVSPVIKSTSGLQVVYARGVGVVAHVMKNGPAEAAGWKAGDRICSVDGMPAQVVGDTPSLKTWGTGQPGLTVKLGMCNGDKRELTLSSFY